MNSLSLKNLMSKKSDFSDETLDEKFKILLDEKNQIKKWNEGLLIKLLILLPLIIFIVGIFIVNKPESIIDVLYVFLFPIVLIFIGLIINFAMTGDSK